MSTSHHPAGSGWLDEQHLTPSHLEALRDAATTYAWANSLLFKQQSSNSRAPSNTAIHAPFCLLPTPFSRSQFERATRIQTAYNKLYMNIASSPPLIRKVLGQSICRVDPFVGRLYEIWERLENDQETDESEHLYFGIFRGDYLLHQPTPSEAPEIKQVEFNTVSVSFGSLATKISGLHRYLGGLTDLFDRSQLPQAQNEALQSIGKALRMAHEHYLSSQTPSQPAVILMVVKPQERNIYDQSLIEYQLADHPNPIRIHRLSCHQILQFTSVDPNTRKLYYQHDDVKSEVSVVYYRSMYGPEDFLHDDDWNGRYQLERSRAINCPNLSLQLAGCKKFQQIMTVPEFLETHRGLLTSGILTSEWQELQSTWTSIYSLDDPEAYDIASDPVKATDFVLKPQREGGGHNIYGTAIPDFVCRLSASERESYILMRLIKTPSQLFNYLVRPSKNVEEEANEQSERLLELTPTEIISELGIYGFCFCRRKKAGPSTSKPATEDPNQVLFNFQSGHILRTKDSRSDEGGIAVGISCLDSPLLV